MIKKCACKIKYVHERIKDILPFFFRGVYASICMRTYFNIFSIYWSDTSLIASLRLEYWLCTRVLYFLMLCILVLPYNSFDDFRLRTILIH